ncbi:hypothetical protein CC80DRAFT_546397 [Byssothecium circinans]|uniref:Isomerase YbhE n=1 Tax=Byssothecium circinans TaxID=147558 RepID=A0A6A5U0G7_9PLEO|nr:hypothetical protein CC80DRAFT_546397 [Byssothecium circinans]
MRLSKSSLLRLLLAASSTLASPISSLPNATPGQASVTNGKAIYINTNSFEKNAIAAVKINANGTLGEASTTSTEGIGGAAINAMGQLAMPDSLVSQSALTIAGQHIFAVNAGSNTISMLTISPSNPLHLTLIGTPAPLPGTFPNTIAASLANSLVCVGTTGSKAGISCAHFDAQTGIGEMDALRPFPLGQSDPPRGPTNTVSHTFFSEDGNKLFTTVKGDPGRNTTGFLSVFDIDEGVKGDDCVEKKKKVSLSRREVRQSPEGTAVLFGSQIVPGTDSTRIFATDASFGAGILAVSPAPAPSPSFSKTNGTSDSNTNTTINATAITLIHRRPIPAQRATCWSAISPLTHTAFVTDVAVNRIVEMSLTDASILSTIDLRNKTMDAGLIDLRAAGRFLYVLSPGNGTAEAAVLVVDISGRGRERGLVQRRGLGDVRVGGSAMGMAVLV